MCCVYGKDGSTGLMVAVSYGHVEVTRVLVEEFRADISLHNAVLFVPTSVVVVYVHHVYTTAQ